MAGQKPIVKEFLLNGAEGDIFCDLFTFEAPSGMERLGTLFVVAELKGAPKIAWGVPNLITSAMRRTYFEKADRRPAQAFTMALKEANNVLMHEISSGNEGWLGTSSFVAFILTEQSILASRAGSKTVGIWLMRNTVRSDIFNADSKGIAPFSSLVSGKIETNDILFAGTSNSFSTIGNDMHDLDEIYRVVQKKLTDRSASGALIINIPAKEPAVNPFAPLVNSKLIPTNLNPVTKISNSVLFTGKLTKWFSLLIISKIQTLFERISNISIFRKIVININRNPRVLKYIYKIVRSGINLRWTAPPKSIVVGMLLIALGFGLIKTATYAVNLIKQEDNKPSPAVLEIEKKIDGARTALIYGDKKQAAQLLGEAQENIKLLEQQKISASVLGTLSSSWIEINNQLFAIKNVVSENILILKGFPIPFNPKKIYLSVKADGNSVLTFSDNEVGALYRFFLEDKKGSIVLRSKKGGFVSVLRADKSNLYVAGRDGVTLYNEEAETFASTLPYENKEDIIFGVGLDKFSLLGDAQNGQLWKIALEKEVLKNTGAWLKKADKATVGKVTDAAWDGKSVWMLRNDGIISRYTNGVRSENITLTNTEKDFHADSLELAPGPYLIVLDGKAGKIIRFTAKGVSETQYINKDIMGATDFTLSADGKVAYVLVNNLVQKIILE
ncbi:MAG: hypothetical protein UU22_C0042G0004 [Parcubacteria group bacterium GW2011_GWA2_40_8]|nr:MAG: hypothetical protein UU22_C0042G0004 [Parcubacteria group bacterium GW2011_GWA2_40_8]